MARGAFGIDVNKRDGRPVRPRHGQDAHATWHGRPARELAACFPILVEGHGHHFQLFSMGRRPQAGLAGIICLAICSDPATHHRPVRYLSVHDL